ncbi:hypothetical protein LTR08_003648 [Meristemomyces frigidus]|nr:hypothetical protein LTR08_003648 [Meristemomyces frigidus]
MSTTPRQPNTLTTYHSSDPPTAPILHRFSKGEYTARIGFDPAYPVQRVQIPGPQGRWEWVLRCGRPLAECGECQMTGGDPMVVESAREVRVEGRRGGVALPSARERRALRFHPRAEEFGNVLRWLYAIPQCAELASSQPVIDEGVPEGGFAAAGRGARPIVPGLERSREMGVGAEWSNLQSCLRGGGAVAQRRPGSVEPRMPRSAREVGATLLPSPAWGGAGPQDALVAVQTPGPRGGAGLERQQQGSVSALVPTGKRRIEGAAAQARRKRARVRRSDGGDDGSLGLV